MNETVTRDLRRINRCARQGTTRENDRVCRRQGREVERATHTRRRVGHGAAREDIRDLVVDTVDGDGTRAEGGRITGRRDASVDDRAATVGVSRGKG